MNKHKKSEIKIIFEKYSRFLYCFIYYKGNFWRNYMYWYDNLRHTEKLIFWILSNKRLKIAMGQSDLTLKLA